MADRDTDPVTNVARIKPEHKLITAPAEMRSLPAWVCWRAEQYEGEPKPRKIAYWASGGKRHGKQGNAEDRSKLVTFPAAVAAAQRLGMDGVGFAPLPEWGIVALDFDQCVGPDGHLPAEVAAIVKDTFCEYSPSGQGVRAFVRGNLGNRKSHAKGNDFGFEIFSTAGFTTVTGNILPHVDLLDLEDVVAPVTPAVVELCAKRFGQRDNALDADDPFAGYEPKLSDMSVERMESLLEQLDPDMGRDEWIRVGMSLHHQCEGDDTGFALWDEWSAQGGKYPGEESLRSQWDSFTRRAGPGQRQVTMASVLKMVNDATSVTDEDFTALAVPEQSVSTHEGVRTPDDYDGKFKAVSASAMALRPPIRWWVQGILPQTSDPIVLFGASGSGKSFVSFDMAAAMAREVDWHDRKVRKARVLILAAEGAGGLGKRFKAYAKHHGISLDDLDVGVIEAAPNFLQKEDVVETARTIKACRDIDILFIDTLAQISPGANENAGEDMGPVLANARAIHNATGVTIVIIHHAGKDASKGSRGWSGIKGAAAAQIEVIKHDDGQREIHIEKMKDGADGVRFGFRFEHVDLGMDLDGNPLESMVVVPAELRTETEDSAPARGVERFGRHERHVLEIAEAEFGSVESVALATLVAACASALPEPETGKRDSRRFQINRAIQSLAKRKEAPLGVIGGKVIFYT